MHIPEGVNLEAAARTTCGAVVARDFVRLMEFGLAQVEGMEMRDEAAGPDFDAPPDFRPAEVEGSVNLTTDLTTDELRIEPFNCGVCGGTAEVTQFGQLMAAKCMVSETCEISSVGMHPNLYRKGYDSDHPEANAGQPFVARALPCGGPECTVTVRFAGPDGEPLDRPVFDGVCKVDTEGEVFHRKGRNMLDAMPLTAPGADVDEFDGEPTAVPTVEEGSRLVAEPVEGAPDARPEN